MVSPRPTQRSPKRRHVTDLSVGSSKETVSNPATEVTSKLFAEESDLPHRRLRPTLPTTKQDFVLQRCDEIADLIPPAPEPKVLTIEFDPVVVHTVALLRYRRMLLETGITAARIGPVPQCSTAKSSLNSRMDATEQLPEATAEMLLCKSVEMLCAHSGFVETDSRVVKLLAKLIASKLGELWRSCKTSNVRRIEGKETAFTSPVMQALQQSGIARLSDLHDFYTHRFRSRRDELLRVCQRGRKALLRPPDKRSVSKKKRREGSRSDSEEESRKRDRSEKEASSTELNFLDD